MTKTKDLIDPHAMNEGEHFRPFNRFVGIIIPKTLASNGDLKHGSKLTFGKLARYNGNNGQCNPSLGTIAEDLDVTKRSASRYKKELVEKGYIKVGSKNDGDSFSTNSYSFIWVEDLADSLKNENGSEDSWDVKENSEGFDPDDFKEGEEYSPYKKFNGPFIPEPILKEDVSQGAKLCYGHLNRTLGKEGDSLPSINEIAEALGVSKGSAVGYVKELKDAELIDTIEPEGIERVRHRRNRYKFKWKEEFVDAIKRETMGIGLDKEDPEYKDPS